MNKLLLDILSFLIILGPLVLIHEFGHFIAARLVGITVLEFGIGFPPRALKLFEQGGTIFSLNWLPIGGFVRPLGEDFVKPVGETATEAERAAYMKYQADMEALGKKVARPKSVHEATPLQRIFFMSAGVIFNFIGAFVILMIAAMLGRNVPVKSNVTIADVVEGSPAARQGLQSGDIITEINGIQIMIAKDAVDQMKKSTLRGIEVTYKRGDETLKTPKMRSGRGDFSVPANGVVVTEVAAKSPAEAVFKVDDRIIRMDQTDITATDLLVNYVRQKGDQEVTVTFIRDGKEQTAKVTPRKNPPSGQGPLGITIVVDTTEIDPAFGFSLSDEKPYVYDVERATFVESIGIASTQFSDLMNRIIQAPAMIIRGALTPAEARPVSIVGISQMGGSVLQESINTGESYPLLGFAAVISIALGVTNLLPIPALDGGRIMFVIIEMLRGKPIDPEKEGYVHLVGLVVLLALSLLLIFNDIINPITLPGIGK